MLDLEQKYPNTFIYSKQNPDSLDSEITFNYNDLFNLRKSQSQPRSEVDMSIHAFFCFSWSTLAQQEWTVWSIKSLLTFCVVWIFWSNASSLLLQLLKLSPEQQVLLWWMYLFQLFPNQCLVPVFDFLLRNTVIVINTVYFSLATIRPCI